MLSVEVDLVFRAVQPEANRPLSGAAVDVIDKQQVQQLTKIAHRILGATAPDDRCLTDPAGNEPA